MDIFDFMRAEKNKGDSPLARRMRPQKLEDIVGQEHILAKDRLLYRIIKADKLSSIILYGPPGTGKTSLAKVIANTTSANFKEINATTSGKKDMEEIVSKAKDDLRMFDRKTILFVDEIHRFNKAQQDYLLPRISRSLSEMPYTTREEWLHMMPRSLRKRLISLPIWLRAMRDMH